MEPFSVHTGVGVPLRTSSIDTDQIAPSRFLKRIERFGYETALFATWREDPDFVLNRPELSSASILVAGVDFGIGSSREIAVWSLQDYGFRAIIAPRFGDIFRTNAGKSGLVTAVVPEVAVRRLWDLLDENPVEEIMVDLERQLILCGDGFVEPFTIDPYARWQLLNGLDDISVTLLSGDEIAAYEEQRPRWKPSISPRS
jgi:3-isopropylmalate/(R)-2-methylmalate dehydratase small subunit